jgi:deoxyribodipyrimidine photo-lyase
MGFLFGQTFPMPVVDRDLISIYDERRDYPGLDGTSHLGIHLRFIFQYVSWPLEA